MPSTAPTKKVLADLKASILSPAQTSHYQCWFTPPPLVQSWVNSRKNNYLGSGWNGKEEFYSLSCAEASLPGASLATHTLDNDHTGITERHAYRKQYDTTSSFTFYVDKDYAIIYFFQNWMNYIVNENIDDPNLVGPQYNYRVQFPNDYETQHLYINKFEKDYEGRLLTYVFCNAYPISMDTMQVSYQASQLLRCVVNFNFSRYYLSGMSAPSTTTSTTTNTGTALSQNFVGPQGELNFPTQDMA